jgi:hypothetical protein
MSAYCFDDVVCLLYMLPTTGMILTAMMLSGRVGRDG